MTSQTELMREEVSLTQSLQKKIENLELDIRAYKKTTSRMAKEINDLKFNLNVEKRINKAHEDYSIKMEMQNDELHDKIDDLESDIADLVEVSNK